MTETITDDELLRRIEREERFIDGLSRVTPEMRAFEEWAHGASSVLRKPHTFATARTILAEWTELREPLINPRWLPNPFGRAFSRRVGDVALVEHLDEFQEAISTSELRRAEDGSEMLYALAHHLTQHGALSYAEQVSNAAHAVRQLTRQHDSADPAPENDPGGAGEHTGEIGRKLRLTGYNVG